MRSLHIVILVLATFVVKGQSAELFKGANTIIFECKDSGEDLYVRLGKHLISRGYTIIGDKDFLSIRTRRRSFSDFSGYSYTVNGVIENNRATFTIDITDGERGTQTMAWRYASMPLGIGKNAHEHFLEYMAEFEKLSVSYDKY